MPSEGPTEVKSLQSISDKNKQLNLAIILKFLGQL